MYNILNDRIIIVGSSQEAIKFKPVKGYSVIAVNQAIDITKHNTDYWFTLDPSVDNQKIMDSKPYNCQYIAAVSKCYGTKTSKLNYYRRNRQSGVIFIDRIIGSGPNGEHYGLCENENQIATGNSAYGALNLAYHMRPKEIVLLGIDGSQSTKFDGLKCKDLSHLPKLFESAYDQLYHRGITIHNANRQTKLINIPYSNIFD